MRTHISSLSIVKTSTSPYAFTMGQIGLSTIAKRAFREAAEFVRWPKASAVITAIFAATGSGILIYFNTGTLSYSVMGGVLGVIVLFLGVFIFKMFTVPVTMINEEIATREVIEAKQRTKAERDVALTKIVDLIKTGSDLYRQAITSADEFDKWVENYRLWAVSATNAVELAFSSHRANAFIQITGSSILALPGGNYNDKHMNGRIALREWTGRLRDMINLEN